MFLNAHRNSIKSTFSYVDNISLGWLRNLLYGVLAVYFIWVIEELVSDFINLSDIFNTMLGASMVMLVYSMSFLGLRQPIIFTGKTAALVLERSDTVADIKDKVQNIFTVR